MVDSFDSLSASEHIPKVLSVNARVACEPLQSTHIETETRSGVTMAKNKGVLIELAVLFDTIYADTLRLRKGDSVFVRGDSFTQPWSKEVFKVDNVSFILVPKEAILMAKV